MRTFHFSYISVLLFLFACTSNQESEQEQDQRMQRLKTSAYNYLKENNYNSFKTVNKHYKNYAVLKKDSLSIADADWNYAIFYDRTEVNDSAYFYYHRSESIFHDLNQTLLEAKQLYNKANMQKRFHDLTGAEINTYKALSLLKNTDYKQRILNRNLLGVIYMQINEDEQAVEQFNNAIQIIQESNENKDLLKSIYNNLAILYQKNEDYDNAIDYFQLALDEVTPEDYGSYSRYTSNLYYTQFLKYGFAEKFESKLLLALKIREDNDLRSSIADSYIKLSDLYLKKPDSILAIDYAVKALDISKEINFFEDELKAYEVLGKIDADNADVYFNSYKSLKDSLDLVDRSTRNKFTRIEYETEQIKERADELLETNKYLILSILLFLLIFVLVFYILYQRNKQKQLELTNQIEIDKIEMYKLAVKSREKTEEGISRERRRISMELHDGVLSSLASIRLSIAVLLKKIKNLGAETIIDYNYEKEINTLENEIRSLSHDLHHKTIEFIDFLEILKDNIKSTDSLKVKIEQNKTILWDEINDYLKSNILRIIQETYKNTSKHAKASKFTITFNLKKEHLTLLIKDNGIGFDVNHKQKGIGLINIKRRVKEFLKGNLTIKTTTTGTLFTITIPNIYD